MLGDQKPQAQLIAGDFVRQQLADIALQAFRIDRFGALLAAGALGLDAGWRCLGIQLVEFFFGVRNRRRLVRYCGC